MNSRLLAALLAAAALAVPAAAVADAGHGKHKPSTKHGAKGKAKKAKKVMFVFKGTFTAPGTVTVTAGNAHVRKGGFVGNDVSFDLASAKLVVADTNADQAVDVTDVQDGDLVLVQARVARKTTYAAPAEGESPEAIVARKLVDRTHAPEPEDEE
jgi:ABC-type amino acid transport substrate-binding protein